MLLSSGKFLESPLKLYPNPASEKVRVDGLPFGTPVVFTNTIGQRFEKQLNQEGKIDIRQLGPGLYTVEAVLEGKIYRQFLLPINSYIS